MFYLTFPPTSSITCSSSFAFVLLFSFPSPSLPHYLHLTTYLGTYVSTEEHPFSSNSHLASNKHVPPIHHQSTNYITSHLTHHTTSIYADAHIYLRVFWHLPERRHFSACRCSLRPVYENIFLNKHSVALVVRKSSWWSRNQYPYTQILKPPAPWFSYPISQIPSIWIPRTPPTFTGFLVAIQFLSTLYACLPSQGCGA